MTRVKVPSKLILTANLSGGLTLTISLLYIALCITALVYRFDCDFGGIDTVSSSGYMWNILYNTYFQDDSCNEYRPFEDLTKSYVVFVLTTVIFSISVLNVIAAISLIFTVTKKDASQYITLVTRVYIGVFIASLVVDITLATHFGMDYKYMNDLLNSLPPGEISIYFTDILRIGTFLLMTVTLKGYVIHLINIILIILLIIYSVNYRARLQREQHPIHKLSILHAYEQNRHHDGWQQQPELNLSFRGSQINPVFYNDDEIPRSPVREQQLSDYSGSRAFDRSESWHHSQPSLGLNAQPFSYLEENRRTTSMKLANSADSWPSSPPAPPVPAPDYSPQPARRLKSALKPTYM